MKGIWIIKILAGIVLFSAGVAAGVPICRMYDKAHTVPAGGAELSGALTEEAAEENPVEDVDSGAVRDELQLRVRDGELEWYDGVRWNGAGKVAQLAAADPISQPSEAWQTLAAQLADARAGEYAAQQASDQESSTLLVDEITVTRPQNTSSAGTRPVTPAAPSVVTQPTAPVNPVPDNNANDDHDDHDDAPAANPNPASTPEPAPVPVPDPEPAPDNTGDGENIEWSGDYD